MNAQLLFFFSALGVFNSLLLSGWLWWKKPRLVSDRWLAILLLMFSIRVGKSIFFYFSPELARLWLQLGLTACLLIGPCLYLYCLAIVKPQMPSRYQFAHLVLPFAAISVIGMLYPYQHHPALWQSLLYQIINGVWLLYILLSVHLLLPLLTGAAVHKAVLTSAQKLSLNIVGGTAVIWLAYATFAYTSYISGALSFSFIVYLSVAIMIGTRQQYYKQQQTKYQHKLVADDVSALQQKLTYLMQDEQLYLAANLTLAQLAKKLGTNTSRLSQFFNDNLQTSFPNYLNALRIAHAKTLLCEDNKLSTEHIADVSGFNSVSTFYNAFKKCTGTTPAQFRQQAAQNLTKT